MGKVEKGGTGSYKVTSVISDKDSTTSIYYNSEFPIIEKLSRIIHETLNIETTGLKKNKFVRRIIIKEE